MSKKYAIACALAIVALVIISGCVQQFNSGSCENNCQDLFAQKRASCVTACSLNGKSDAQCQSDCDAGVQTTITGCVEDCKQKEAFQTGSETYCTTITGLSEYDQCFEDVAVQYGRPADCREVIDENGALEENIARDCLSRIAKSNPAAYGPNSADNLCNDPLFYYTTDQDGLRAGDARPEKFTCETEAIGAAQSSVNCTSIIAIMLVAVSAYACRKDGI